jgi:hypothetical protein
MEVGYKVLRDAVLRRIYLKSDRFGFAPELAIKVARLGGRICEIPIRYYGGLPRTQEDRLAKRAGGLFSQFSAPLFCLKNSAESFAFADSAVRIW